MGFWLQVAGTAALFAVVEGTEALLRAVVPGLPNAVYWAVKVAVGLPLVIAVAWHVREVGYRIDVAAVIGGLAGAASVALWLHGEDGEDGDDTG